MGTGWTIPGWVLEQANSTLGSPGWDVIYRPAQTSNLEPLGPGKIIIGPPGISTNEWEKFRQSVEKIREDSYQKGATPEMASDWISRFVHNYMMDEYPWARARSLGGVSDRNVINDAKNYRKYFKQAAQEMLATGKLEFYQQRVPTDAFVQFSEIFNKAMTRPDLLTDPEIGVLLGAGFDPWGVAERASEQEKIMQAMLPPPPSAQPPPPPPTNNASQPRATAPAQAQPASADALLAALFGGVGGGAPGFAAAPPSAPVASPVPGVGGGFDPRTFGREFINNQRLMARGALSPAAAAAMYNRVPAAPALPQNAMFGALSPYF